MDLEDWLQQPHLDETLIGAAVRVALSTSKYNEPQYSMCIIQDVVDSDRYTCGPPCQLQARVTFVSALLLLCSSASRVAGLNSGISRQYGSAAHAWAQVMSTCMCRATPLQIIYIYVLRGW